MNGKRRPRAQRGADEKNRAALARIRVEREEAGLCRHCGGPVPCWSPFGDVLVGVRYGDPADPDKST